MATVTGLATARRTRLRMGSPDYVGWRFSNRIGGDGSGDGAEWVNQVLPRHHSVAMHPWTTQRRNRFPPRKDDVQAVQQWL
jgi:hypothetical protein